MCKDAITAASSVSFPVYFVQLLFGLVFSFFSGGVSHPGDDILPSPIGGPDSQKASFPCRLQSHYNHSFTGFLIFCRLLNLGGWLSLPKLKLMRAAPPMHKVVYVQFWIHWTVLRSMFKTQWWLVPT